jgi:hypothetical protein
VERGRLIAQRYQLEERLGAGGMGVVWRATDVELGRTVALKKSQSQDEGQIRREAKMGAGVAHPHVVTVYDSILDGGERWLVTEYLAARNLAEILREDGPLPAPAVRRIGGQLADAVAAMHAKGMVHRDIKPSNVLVAADGTAKLTDLGIARWAEVTQTSSAQLAGTTGYVAPEVADGADGGTAADVFSLGATLFAAVEGSSPWGDGERGPMAQLRRAANFQLEPTRKADELTPVLRALMSRRPGDRPSAAVARDLLADPATAPAEPVRRRWRVARRHWAIAGAILTIAMVAGVLIVMANESGENTANSAGLTGDERTADPCALLEPESLSRFGQVALEPNYGNFNHCDLLAVVDEDGAAGVVDVSVDLMEPDVDPATPPTRGVINRIERFNPEPGEPCVRSITLPDLKRAVITARYASAKAASLCSMADATALDVYATLTQGPIPRRTKSFSATSTASLHSCEMLTPAEVEPFVDANAVADPEFGDWGCYWGDDRSVYVRFFREWELEPNDDEGDGDGVPINVRDRRAFVDADEDEDDPSCTVAIVHSTYPIDSPVLETPHTREEIVEVRVFDDAATDVSLLCADATTLADAVVGRLPAAP